MAKRWECMSSGELWEVFIYECTQIGICVVKCHNYDYHLKRTNRLNELIEARFERNRQERLEASNEQ